MLLDQVRDLLNLVSPREVSRLKVSETEIEVEFAPSPVIIDEPPISKGVSDEMTEEELELYHTG